MFISADGVPDYQFWLLYSTAEPRTFLFIGMGFLCFGISHAFKIADSVSSIPWMESGTFFDWILISIRIIGYLLCLWAVISAK